MNVVEEGHLDLEHFKEEKITERERLKSSSIKVFSQSGAIAIDQFGSGANGYKDEFSDLDLWVTFPDNLMDNIKDNTDQIYSRIGKVLIKCEVPSLNPLRGRYNFVIFDQGNNLYNSDFHLAIKSNSKVLPEAKHLWGDTLPHGERVVEQPVIGHNTAEGDLNYLICMAYMLIVANIRGGWDKTHADFLRNGYGFLQQYHHQQFPSLPDGSDFVFLRKLLENLKPVSDSKQLNALTRIQEYADKTSRLYKE